MCLGGVNFFLSRSIDKDVDDLHAIVRIKEIIFLCDGSPVINISMTVSRLSSSSSRKTSCQMPPGSSDKTLRKSLFEKFLTIETVEREMKLFIVS